MEGSFHLIPTLPPPTPMDEVSLLHPLTKNIYIYYIDTSVLLENIPLIKFIKTTSGTRVVYFP